MESDLEQRISHRTNEMWQAAGSPEGRNEEFRQQAEKDVTAEQETYKKLNADPNVTTNS
ncbi:DUF2934 domain-containing protein [Rhodopseudomonas parapalustris]